MILNTKHRAYALALKGLVTIVITVIAFSISPLLPQNTANATSNVHVVLSDYRPNSTGVKYTIDFNTAGGPGASIEIYFERYSESESMWVPNNSVVNEGVASNNITCNGGTVGTIFAHSKMNGTLGFSVPAKAKTVTNIEVVILASAGFGNGIAGSYRVRIVTANNTNSAYSPIYKISNPKLSNVTVKVNPPNSGKNARYTITAVTSNYNSSVLSGGSDQIRVQFPAGTSLPTTIDADTISVKYGSTEKFVSTSTYVSGNAVQFTIPSGISVPKNSLFTVIFYETAHIYNPSVPSDDYKLSMETLDSGGNVKDDLTDSSPYSIFSTSVTSVSVSAEPLQVEAAAKYTINFKTSTTGSLAAGSGEIHIKFQDAFFVPPTISSAQVSINNVAPESVKVTGKEIVLVVSQAIEGGSDVSVTIQGSAGIKNPAQNGTYKLSVWTSSDATPVYTPDISISPSAVHNAKVTVIPQLAGMQAMYIVTFQTGTSGLLDPGDTIVIKFPEGTFIPSSMPVDKVKVNNQKPQNVLVSGTTVSIVTASPIPSNFTVIVQFNAESGIKNPSTPGTYEIFIHTTKETNDTKSSSYSIIKRVSTSLNITPSSPDGKNGFYKTSPMVEIKADVPQGLSYTIYYKLDDEANFKKYQSSIAIPDGNHTLYYYSVDSYNNKEPLHMQSFKVDTQKPILSITSPSANQTFYDKSVAISGVTEPGVDLLVSTGSTKTQLSVDKNGKFQFNFTFSNEGDVLITFTAEDEAGNLTILKFPLKYVFQRNIMLVVGTKEAYVNGNEKPLKEAPFIYKGRVLVPVRFVSEVLGAVVNWDKVFKIVIISLNNKIVRLQVGNHTADAGDGKIVKLDVAPVIKDGTTFVPIRFISEALGAKVEWDSVHGIVRITYPKNQQGGS